MSGTTDALKRVMLGRALRSDRWARRCCRSGSRCRSSAPTRSPRSRTRREQILLVLATAGPPRRCTSPRRSRWLWRCCWSWSLRRTDKPAYAYPSGGGAYVVSKDQPRSERRAHRGHRAAGRLRDDRRRLGRLRRRRDHLGRAASLAPHAVALSVGFVVMLALANLRGVKESGTRVRGPDVRVRGADVPAARPVGALQGADRSICRSRHSGPSPRAHAQVGGCLHGAAVPTRRSPRAARR